jgi:hypothetical protein
MLLIEGTTAIPPSDLSTSVQTFCMSLWSSTAVSSVAFSYLPQRRGHSYCVRKFLVHDFVVNKKGLHWKFLFFSILWPSPTRGILHLTSCLSLFLLQNPCHQQSISSSVLLLPWLALLWSVSQKIIWMPACCKGCGLLAPLIIFPGADGTFYTRVSHGCYR